MRFVRCVSAYQTLSDITPSTSCNEIQQTVNQAINKLKEVFNNLQNNELKTATTYLNNVESYVSKCTGSPFLPHISKYDINSSIALLHDDVMVCLYTGNRIAKSNRKLDKICS